MAGSGWESRRKARAEVTESTMVPPATDLIFLALSYGVGTCRWLPVQGTRGCAGTSGQGAGDGRVLGAGPHPRCGVSHRLSKDKAPKVCGEQTAAPPRAQAPSAAAGVPLVAPGVPRDPSWSRRWCHAASQRSDPGQHRAELQARRCSPPPLPGHSPSHLPNAWEICSQAPSCLRISSSCWLLRPTHGSAQAGSAELLGAGACGRALERRWRAWWVRTASLQLRCSPGVPRLSPQQKSPPDLFCLEKQTRNFLQLPGCCQRRQTARDVPAGSRLGRGAAGLCQEEKWGRNSAPCTRRGSGTDG